jgi:hypothetical protein
LLVSSPQESRMGLLKAISACSEIEVRR